MLTVTDNPNCKHNQNQMCWCKPFAVVDEHGTVIRTGNKKEALEKIADRKLTLKRK